MEHSPQPMFENERTGLSHDCEAILVVAAMQRVIKSEQLQETE